MNPEIITDGIINYKNYPTIIEGIPDTITITDTIPSSIILAPIAPINVTFNILDPPPEPEPEKSEWHKQQVADLKERLNIT